MSGRPIVHIEIPAQSPAKLSAFYKELFGWELQSVPGMPYVTFKTSPMQFGDPGLGGGFPPIDGQLYKPGDVTVYIGSGDIEADLKQIERLGGKTVLPKTEIPSTGWYALFTDPDGNRLALFTPSQM